MPQTSEQILQQEYLLARAKILELAANARPHRSGWWRRASSPANEALARRLKILTGHATQASRAEQVQLLFSRQYAADWRQTFGV